MLFEKITYPDDFPLCIRIFSVSEYPYHYHQDVEFLYILQGEVQAKDVSSTYLLKEGDIFTFNGREVHGLTATSSDNLVAVIQISNRFFTQYFPSLPKGCFMTYVERDINPKLDSLRKMLLQIMLEYEKKSYNYKNNCVYQMIEVIRLLNQYFNLFAFDGDDIINFKNDNPVVIERISRIINYIYANHSEKITLEDIAREEHLSTYYLSHIIHEYMGISFQDFVCFARVEMSEIPLLQTSKKISAVAKETGFSSTAYYEKVFNKWFNHSPAEHRNIFLPHILSEDNPAALQVPPDNLAVTIIRKLLSTLNAQEESSSTMRQFNMNVRVQPDADAIATANKTLKLIITPGDFTHMGEELICFLQDLSYPQILLSISRNGSDSESKLIENKLRYLGYDVTLSYDTEIPCIPSSGYDSIAAAIQLVQSYFSSEMETFIYRLRDLGDKDVILKGGMGCLTSGFIPKPSYYACRLLQNAKGKLISCGKFHYVLKDEYKEDSYIIVILNYNDAIQHLCISGTGIYETNDTINSFIDEMTIDISIPVSDGKYIITKHALSNQDSIFFHMSQLGFPDKVPVPDKWLQMLNTGPQSQVGIEEIKKELNISATVSGAGIKFITVNKF